MKKVEHLIEKFVPEHYVLKLDLSRESKSFQGQVKIEGEILDKDFKLHQKELSFDEIKVNSEKVDFEIDEENTSVEIHAPETGDAVVEIKFNGKITDNMDGIYPCYYTESGEKKELLATQFESHFAREAFPCVDEPAAKATFDLELKFDQKPGEVALSNMPELNAGEGASTGVWTFQTTPRMSTYLLAFVLGDLQSVKTETTNGTEVSVYSTKAHPLNSLNYALNIAKRAIEFYEEYYGVKYPLPLSQHVALPDFSAGAMENWGLVTYREIYLPIDPNSTLDDRQQAALVISHELAHMWFGNLVTMNWWDNLWLNESFANMMEYVCVNALHPEWNIFELFHTSDAPAALKKDATDGVQSVQVKVNHPDEINTIFDSAIVYAKGSRLLQMLRYGLGDDDFRKGLNIYFNRHKYGNTSGQDLWNALGEASGKDVASFMNSWLTQPGYPVVSVSLDGDQIKLEQKQFFIGEHEDKGRLYQAPLNSAWDEVQDVFTEESTSIDNYSDLRKKNDTPFRLNDNNMAHYIANYQGELFEDILDNLDSFDRLTKYQLVQERILLAESGEISYAELIPLLQALDGETSYMVVSAVNRIINGLKLFVENNEEAESQLKNLAVSVNLDNYERLGLVPEEGESDEDEKVRIYAVSALLYANYLDFVEDAHELFVKYDEQDDLQALPAAIRSYVLANEVKNYETKKLTDKLLELYKNSNSSSFQYDLSYALSFTEDEETLETILKSWQDKDVVKPQDLLGWYARFLRKEFSQDRVWKWAQDNWDWIKKALGGDMSFDGFVIIPGNVFNTPGKLKEYREFFEAEIDNFALKRNIEMAMKQIKSRIALKDKDQEAVIEALLSL